MYSAVLSLSWVLICKAQSKCNFWSVLNCRVDFIYTHIKIYGGYTQYLYHKSLQASPTSLFIAVFAASASSNFVLSSVYLVDTTQEYFKRNSLTAVNELQWNLKPITNNWPKCGNGKKADEKETVPEGERERKGEREKRRKAKRAPTGDAIDNKSAGNSINANALEIFYTISS